MSRRRLDRQRLTLWGLVVPGSPACRRRLAPTRFMVTMGVYNANPCMARSTRSVAPGGGVHARATELSATCPAWLCAHIRWVGWGKSGRPDGCGHASSQRNAGAGRGRGLADVHQYGGRLQRSLSPELEPDTESAFNARTHDERRCPGRPGRPHRAAVGVWLRRRVLCVLGAPPGARPDPGLLLRRARWHPNLVTDVREAAHGRRRRLCCHQRCRTCQRRRGARHPRDVDIRGAGKPGDGGVDRGADRGSRAAPRGS